MLWISRELRSLEIHNIRGFEDNIIVPFLADLRHLPSQMLSRIVLQTGRMSGDILRRSIFYFKHLRSLVKLYSQTRM
jgi:hypothetical protein